MRPRSPADYGYPCLRSFVGFECDAAAHGRVCSKARDAQEICLEGGSIDGKVCRRGTCAPPVGGGTCLFGLRIRGAEGTSVARPHGCPDPRSPAHRGTTVAAGCDDASVQDRCEWRARAGYPRRRRDHLQPRERTGPVAGKRPGSALIASITKVMTTVVFLEDNPDLDGRHRRRGDVYAASTTYLKANDRLKLSDVLHLTLIASDNAAARVLARVSHGGTASFVERMNEKAIELGLETTTFADPSGLNPANMSSAYDLSRLISFAAADERIAPIMRTPTYSFQTTAARSASTAPIASSWAATSTFSAARPGSSARPATAWPRCFASQGNQVAVVVLGARSNHGRFWETRHLFNWMSDKASSIFSKEEQQPQQ